MKEEEYAQSASVAAENNVEAENNDDIAASVPFQPKDVKITTKYLNIGDLVEMLEHDEIKLNAEFQRLPNLWNIDKKSKFIESLLLGLPIPAFFFDGANDNSWSVIDGLQRISTLEHFIVKKEQGFKLNNLEFLHQFNDKKFSELPREYQRRIKTFPITGYILDKGAPEQVKYNIFKRINQGGLVLTPQEIRHALHQGIPATFVENLVRSNKNQTGQAFVRTTCGVIKTERMEDRDFATRFISFYLLPYTTYEPDLDSFMNKGMAAIRTASKQKLEQMEKDFLAAMDTAWDIFDKDAFRKRFDPSANRKSINKALFEVLSVKLAQLTPDKRKQLIVLKEIFKQKFIELCKDPIFLRSISDGTAKKDSVYYRFTKVEKIIQETLNY
ncbi:MAG: hypothetical protein RLZZ628_531 [Bacteroidota bacterium]|jgi:hypothetical protein